MNIGNWQKIDKSLEYVDDVTVYQNLKNNDRIVLSTNMFGTNTFHFFCDFNGWSVTPLPDFGDSKTREEYEEVVESWIHKIVSFKGVDVMVN